MFTRNYSFKYAAAMFVYGQVGAVGWQVMTKYCSQLMV